MGAAAQCEGDARNAAPQTLQRSVAPCPERADKSKFGIYELTSHSDTLRSTHDAPQAWVWRFACLLAVGLGGLVAVCLGLPWLPAGVVWCPRVWVLAVRCSCLAVRLWCGACGCGSWRSGVRVGLAVSLGSPKQ